MKDRHFDALAGLMRQHQLITLQLIWPKSKRKYFSRNPFAGSGVVEAEGDGPPETAGSAGVR